MPPNRTDRNEKKSKGDQKNKKSFQIDQEIKTKGGTKSIEARNPVTMEISLGRPQEKFLQKYRKEREKPKRFKSNL